MNCTKRPSNTRTCTRTCMSTTDHKDGEELTLEHPGAHKLAAWMGSTRGAVPTPSASPSAHFFPNGKSSKNPGKILIRSVMRTTG